MEVQKFLPEDVPAASAVRCAFPFILTIEGAGLAVVTCLDQAAVGERAENVQQLESWF